MSARFLPVRVCLCTTANSDQSFSDKRFKAIFHPDRIFCQSFIFSLNLCQIFCREQSFVCRLVKDSQKIPATICNEKQSVYSPPQSVTTVRIWIHSCSCSQRSCSWSEWYRSWCQLILLYMYPGTSATTFCDILLSKTPAHCPCNGYCCRVWRCTLLTIAQQCKVFDARHVRVHA